MITLLTRHWWFDRTHSLVLLPPAFAFRRHSQTVKTFTKNRFLFFIVVEVSFQKGHRGRDYDCLVSVIYRLLRFFCDDYFSYDIVLKRYLYVMLHSLLMILSRTGFWCVLFFSPSALISCETNATVEMTDFEFECGTHWLVISEISHKRSHPLSVWIFSFYCVMTTLIHVVFSIRIFW